MSCTAGGHRTRAHHNIVAEVTRLASAALLAPQRETHPFLAPHESLRPDFVIETGDTIQVFDFALTHPFASPDGIACAQKSPGASATQYQVVKSRKYDVPSAAINATFIPLIADTAGAWGDKALPFIRQLGRNLKRYYRACTSYATQQTAAHLSTTVQREVARLIIRHLHHIHARLEVAHLV